MIQNRFLGAIIGLAAGDALGAAVEFKSRGSFKPLTDLRDGGPFNLPVGYWTDDTSMALALADSLLEKGFDVRDQMARYCDWFYRGRYSSTGECFDIGATVRASLEQFKFNGEAFAGSTHPQTAGNGSLMRLAPIPLYFLNDTDEILGQMAVDSSRTTHAAPTCLDACRYYAVLIKGAVMGADKSDLLAPYFSNDPDYWQKHPLVTLEIKKVVEGSFKKDDDSEIFGTGYVVRSMEAALWAFERSSTFEEGALLAANLGDDADTTSAIYGQLAGAFYGLDAIPQKWRDKLALPVLLERINQGLWSRLEDSFRQ